jgi:hypothetical protein
MRQFKTLICEYCSKTSRSQPEMISHERNCYFNRANHGCPTCFWNIGGSRWEHPKGCHLGLLDISSAGQPIKLKRKCPNWIDSYQANSLKEFFNKNRNF